MKVKISKFSSLDGRPASLGDGYTVEVFLLENITIGQPIMSIRTRRNGEDVLGYFRTSPVMEINEIAPGIRLAVTENSVYHVEDIQ